MGDVAGAVRELASELELLERILRVSRLQHGRALYYHRLRHVQKRLAAAVSCCRPPELAQNGGKAAACTAAEVALDAIPSPWTRLRHLMAQTYFMTFALTCMALLSRAATLLARIHADLGGGNGGASACEGVGLMAQPRLLALARPRATPSAFLGRVFGDGARPAASSAAERTSNGDGDGDGDEAKEEEEEEDDDDGGDDLGEVVASDGDGRDQHRNHGEGSSKDSNNERDGDDDEDDDQAEDDEDDDRGGVEPAFFLDPLPSVPAEASRLSAPMVEGADDLTLQPTPAVAPAASTEASFSAPEAEPDAGDADACGGDSSAAAASGSATRVAISAQAARSAAQHGSTRRLLAKGSLLQAHISRTESKIALVHGRRRPRNGEGSA
jgi:hypothetical protein